MSEPLKSQSLADVGFIEDVLTDRVHLPHIPKVVAQVLADLQRSEVSIAELADHIGQDPVLSSRILRMANSAAYGRSRSLSSIAEAVNLIGIRGLQSLVAISGSMSSFADTPGVSLRHFWLLSLITGTAAKQVAQPCGLHPDAAYSAGLLQAIGHLILCRSHPEQAQQGLSPVKHEWGVALASREVTLFGIAHPEISALWVDKLGMPQAIADAVLTSLYPLSVSAPPLARVLRLACYLADAVGEGRSMVKAREGLEADLIQALSLADYVSGHGFELDYAELQTLTSPF